MRSCLFFLFLLLSTSCDFPKAVSGSFSKEFCSCYFLIGHEKQTCYSYAKQMIEISDYKIDEKEKTIWSSGLLEESTAKFISKKYGCRLIKQGKN